MLHLIRLYRLVVEDDPGVLVRHLLRLLAQLLLLRGQHLRHWQPSLSRFLFQHLLLIFKSEELSTVVKHGFEELFVLSRLDKVAELRRDLLLRVVFLVFEHLLIGNFCSSSLALFLPITFESTKSFLYFFCASFSSLKVVNKAKGVLILPGFVYKVNKREGEYWRNSCKPPETSNSWW